MQASYNAFAHSFGRTPLHEDRWAQSRIGPHIHISKREKWILPTQGHYAQDVYRPIRSQPVLHVRSKNAESYVEQARNKFKRWSPEQQFANTQGRPSNGEWFNIAAANGHPTGRPGIMGGKVEMEHDPSLGGMRSVNVIGARHTDFLPY